MTDPYLPDFVFNEETDEVLVLPHICPVIILIESSVLTSRKLQPQFDFSLDVGFTGSSM